MGPPAAERLRRSPDVRRVLRRGARASERRLVVHALDRGDDAPARVTAVASRRVGGAVERNRAKRLLREAVRTTGLPPGHDVALVARAAAPGASLTSVRADLAAALTSLALLVDEHTDEHTFGDLRPEGHGDRAEAVGTDA